MSWTQAEIDQALVEVKKRSAMDKGFRESLLQDPNKAIAELAQKEIPAGMKIKIIESDPAYHMTFVLPPLASDDLSEEDLEKVAGGICGIEGCGAEACAGKASR